MSYIEKIKNEQNCNLYFLSSSTGIKYYAYVLVPRKLKDKFNEDVKQNNFDFGEYGIVLDYCFGTDKPYAEKAEQVSEFLKFLT